MHLAFRFGASAAGLHHSTDAVDIALPNAVLAGTGREQWAANVSSAGDSGSLSLWRSGNALWGVGLGNIDDGVFEEAALTLYRDVFHVTADVSLYRIWNFIPRINDTDRALENYRAFCRGRFQAFEEFFGGDSERRMPAASGVGTPGDKLCVVFVAGTDPVVHVENPLQVPAYRYPSQYGPRAPSFARASILPGQTPRLYVSGTASIRGSESLHEGDLCAQLALALDNVDAVARAAGIAEGLNRNSPGQRLFRVYLRHPEHQLAAQSVLDERLLREADVVNVLQADICRRELLAEVEASVVLDPSAFDATSS